MYKGIVEKYNDCEKCIKNNVCKLKKDYEYKLSQLSGIGTPGKFEIIFNCLEYYEAPKLTREKV